MTKVVIVESNNNIREGLKILLESSTRYNCVGSFKTPAAFREKFNDLEFDIILIEIDLPSEEGIKLISMVNESAMSVSILPLTLFEENTKIIEAICSGAHGYIVKITPPKQIVQYLDEISLRMSHMSTFLAKRILNIIDKNHFNSKKLSQTERTILELMADGNSVLAVSERIKTDISVIKRHLYEIYNKLQYFC